MLFILTILLGILFVGLVIRALFYTGLGIGQIALGLIIMPFEKLWHGIRFCIRKIKLWWYLAHRNR